MLTRIAGTPSSATPRARNFRRVDFETASESSPRVVGDLRDVLRTQTRLGAFSTRFPSRFGSQHQASRAKGTRSPREAKLETWLNEVLAKRAVLDPRSAQAVRAFIGAEADGDDQPPKPQSSSPVASFFRLEFFECRDLRLENASLKKRPVSTPSPGFQERSIMAPRTGPVRTIVGNNSTRPWRRTPPGERNSRRSRPSATFSSRSSRA